MGVWFDDPNLDIYDICLFNLLAQRMGISLELNEELISVDNELQTKSCYVELHRSCIHLVPKVSKAYLGSISSSS